MSRLRNPARFLCFSFVLLAGAAASGSRIYALALKVAAPLRTAAAAPARADQLAEVGALPPAQITSSGAADVERARAWVDGRIEGLRAASTAQAGASEEFVQYVDIRGGLKAAGLDPLLADAVGDTLDLSEPARPGRTLRALETTRTRLNGLARAMKRRPPPDLAGSRARLEGILRDSVFVEASREPSFLTRMVHRVRAMIGDLYAALAESAGRHPRALPWLVGALIACTSALFFLMLGKLFVPRRARASLTQTHDLAEIRRPPRRAEDLLESGRRARDAGRLADALALSDLAAIAALRRRGLLPPPAGLTDLEGVRWLAARADTHAHAAFARLVEICDRTLYGGIPATDEGVREAEGLAAGLLAVTAGSGGPARQAGPANQAGHVRDVRDVRDARETGETREAREAGQK